MDTTVNAVLLAKFAGRPSTGYLAHDVIVVVEFDSNRDSRAKFDSLSMLAKYIWPAHAKQRSTRTDNKS
eukprot:6194318-Pleurochrysis_carterae.AAC.1